MRHTFLYTTAGNSLAVRISPRLLCFYFSAAWRCLRPLSPPGHWVWSSSVETDSSCHCKSAKCTKRKGHSVDVNVSQILRNSWKSNKINVKARLDKSIAECIWHKHTFCLGSWFNYQGRKKLQFFRLVYTFSHQLPFPELHPPAEIYI